MENKRVYVIDRDGNDLVGTESEINKLFNDKIDTFIRFYDSSNNKGRKIIIDAIEDLKEIYSKEDFTIDQINSIDINFDNEDSEGFFGYVFYNLIDYLNFLGYESLEDFLEYEELTDIVTDSSEYKEYMVNKSFIGDEEKMIDFKNLSKDEFLDTYSYLTSSEYENTRLLANKSI